MVEPTPRLEPDSPIEVVAARTLFRSDSVRHRGAPSLIRLDSGRLLMAFRIGRGPVRGNDGVVMLTFSDDNGASWDEPFPVYSYPGWDGIPMGGLVRFSDDRIRLIVGRIKVDAALGGDEPFADWYITAIDSRDGGLSWSETGPEIRLFPCWTEMYGASNPHPLSDGHFLLAVMGTTGRDDGWQAGVTISDGESFTLTPVIIAAEEGRNFSDTDLVRLDDGRFLSVSREHVTRQSFFAHSADEGRSWSPIRPTGFLGANIKLFRLRSGAILCAYRDEDRARPGVSCSVSEDGGETWAFIGQLYAADLKRDDVAAAAGVPCGYPDMVRIDERSIVCVLHTYADRDGQVDMHQFHLRDRS